MAQIAPTPLRAAPHLVAVSIGAFARGTGSGARLPRQPAAKGQLAALGKTAHRLGASLAYRLIGLLVVAVLVAGGFVGALVVTHSRQALWRRMETSNLATAEMAADLIGGYVGDVQAELNRFARRPALPAALASGTAGTLTAELRDLAGTHPVLDSAAIVTRDGVVLASGTVGARAEGGRLVGPPSREWFSETLATGNAVLGLPTSSTTAARVVVPYSVPILDEAGTVLGALVGGISLATLAQTVTSLHVGPDARAALVDRRDGGVFLAHVDPQRVLRALPATSPASAPMVAGERRAMASTDAYGVEALIAFAPVPLTSVPWVVAIIQPRAAALAPVAALERQAMLVVGIVSLVTAALGGWLAFSILRPLGRLRAAAAALAGGDLASRAGIRGDDEIGALGRTFDTMADALAHRTSQLEAATSTLERRVEARTAALDEANARLLQELEVRRRAEEQVLDANVRLRKSEEWFRALIEHSADGIALVDATGTVRYVSPAGRRLSGTPAGERPDERPVEDMFDRIHPDDVADVRDRFAALVQDPGAQSSGVFRRRGADGSWFWVDATATNLLGEAAVEAVIVNYRDVTARKKAESDLLETNERLACALAEVSERETVIREHAERQRLLNEFARTVGSTLDLQAVFMLITEQVAALTGGVRCSVAQHEAELGGFRVAAVWHEPLAAPPGAIEELVTGTVIPGEGSCLTVVRRTGAPYVSDLTAHSAEPRVRRLTALGIASMAAVPISIGDRFWGALNVGFAAAGQATAERVAFLEAIAAHLGVAIKNAQLYTDLRAAHEAHQRTQEQVIEQERLRALGTMASGIAHDLNNALAPVVGFSELLLNATDPLADRERAQHFLELIHTGAQDAAHVVRRLREFYRHRDDADVTSDVDVAALVEQVVHLTEPKWKDQAQGEGRTIDVDLDLATVPTVAGREAELREALTNLVFNAVDALPGGGRITIRTRVEGSWITVAVSDTGVGMAEEVLRRCREPFFTTKGERGTGLGLAMVHGVVRRHAGELDLQSGPGRGTTAVVRLPLEPAAAPAVPASEVGAAPAGGPGAGNATQSPAARQHLRVLMADDEESVRRVAAAYLHADGHVVVEAHSGQHAVDLVQRHAAGVPFDVVLVDRAMPGLGGEQTAARIKALAPQVPVVMVTGFGDLMLAAGECPAYVDHVVGKPVTQATLRAALASVQPAERPAAGVCR